MIPPFLKLGSTIGITCPSGYVAFERVSHAVKVLEDWGFRVRLGKTVGNAFNYFSGDDQTRLNDLQQMLDDPGIDAILAGRGGYGLSRIIDDLDFSGFLEHPKWICGFSDITVLHSHIHARYGIPTLHSPMCGAFTPEQENSDYILSVRKALTCAALEYNLPANPTNRIGVAEGVLTGGNLAILSHLTGSVSDIDTAGKILFIEDIGEHLYQIDRMLINLKRSGKLDKLAALVIGDFSDVQDTERPFGQTLAEIISDKVAEFSYPVCFGMPAGHETVNFCLALGMPHRLKVSAEGAHLKMVI